MASHRPSRSPLDLRDRDGLDNELLEPYQAPRVLARPSKQIDSIEQRTDAHDQMPPKAHSSGTNATSKERRSWLWRLSSSSKTERDLRSKLSRRIARLSSLDSTRSSSSAEDPSYSQREAQQHSTMPLISITSNDQASFEPGSEGARPYLSWEAQFGERAPDKPSRQKASISQRRADFYRDHYGREKQAGGVWPASSSSSWSQSRQRARNDAHEDDDEDDDDDAFDDAPLPIPYSSSSMSHTIVRQQTERGVSYASGYNGRLEELLDDRQGMNNSVQQFTKAEKQANRPSLDGSIISNEFRLDSKALQSASGASGSRSRLAAAAIAAAGKAKDKRKGKSLNSMYRSRRHSRRGLLGLASRLKLTKKHESIARLQLSILNSRFVSLKTLDRNLQSFLPRERLTIAEFQKRVKLMRQFEVLANIEYRFASKYETYVCKHAQTETNQPKNNYKKCIPYDYNRIVLKSLPNVPDSDYINASHVDSCLKPNAYIAAQGPNEFTIEDFWRMIWEQKTFVIVMLTKVFDFIRVMCNQYWPVELNKPERYGRIEVTLLHEEPLADFVIRTIKISKLKASATQAERVSGEQNLDGQPAANPAGGQLANGNGLNKGPADSESEGELAKSYASDHTLDSDALEEEPEVVERNEFETPISGQSVSVRAPRFVASATCKGRPATREPSLPPSLQTPSSRPKRASSQSDFTARTPNCDTADRQSSWALTPSGRLSHEGAASNDVTEQPASPLQRARSAQQARDTNEFLHPLFQARQQLGASSNSMSSEPASPLTPRTPSSAGLDRSSATRKAVKKRRRERLKNQRPTRTQFLVPSESQLEDDDDDDDDNDDDDDDNDDDADHHGGRGHQDPLLAGNMGAEMGQAGERAGEPKATKRLKSERIIYQFHYNSWASHTCPFISSLLHFRRRVRICMDEMSKSGKTGPTVVHCNDGCGRTGAYLSIDANLELAEEDNVIDIYNYTRKMRQSRKYLIENLEQYKFVYDTIEEALFCGRTWFPVSELHKRLKQKAQRNPMTRKNEYLLEYERICRMATKFSIGDCAGGHRVENREKNRDVSTVPPDNSRPYLSSFQTNDSTDYVNAVFVDGYTRSKEYIVTEWPLHKTISDFWSLVYDHDCNSVILLANPPESTTYPSFLPSEKELRRKFGPVFSAEMVSYTHYQNIKSWIYTINKKIVSLTEVIAGVKSEAKTTQVFQITCWPQGHRVPTSTNALVELMNMVERWRQRTTYGPVCVVSLNGKSRAGVYCAANVAIEQVVQHSEVDVFNAVKTVRRHRPQLIENMTEYKYCYDLILHYVLHYVNNQSATNA